MTAWSFVLRVPPSPKIVGTALICASEGYLAILWRDAEDFDRRGASPASWTAIRHELLGAMPTPLPWTSIIRETLSHPELNITVTPTGSVHLETSADANAFAVLDAALKRQTLGP